MDNYRKEQEINLIDLCYKIATKWRLVLILMAVCLILACGYKVYGNYSYNKSITATSETDPVSSEEYIQKLTDDEAESVSQAIVIKSQIAQYREYQNNSVYMTLNAYAENVVNLEYWIDTGYTYNENGINKKDYSHDLISAYKAHVDNIDIAINDIKSANDLISIIDTEYQTDDTMLIIRVAGVTAEEAETLAELVDKDIKDYSAKLEKKIGTHTLKLVEKNSAVIKDDALINEQYTVASNISNLRDQLTALTSVFTENQNAAYNALIAEGKPKTDEAVEDVKPETIPITSGLAKYGVLGLLLGIILACIVIAIPYGFSRKLKRADELAYQYGLFLFGDFEDIPVEGSKNNSDIDRWLINLRNKENWTYDEQKELAIANIKLTCMKNDIKEVVLSSTIHLDDYSRKIATDISEGLKSEGVLTVVHDNVIRDIESLEVASEKGKVVLIEKTDVSTYDNIDKIYSTCKEQSIDILGAVVI